MEHNQKPSFFVQLATWIVDKRSLFFLIYGAALIFSLFSRNWVSVNNDITDYLPESTETRQGLGIMEEQFTTFGSARVMVSNISYEQALPLADRLESIEGISTVDFGDEDNAEDRADHYRNSAALFDVTFDGEADDPVSTAAMEELKETLAAYDVSISSSVGESQSETLAAEMTVIMGIAAVIIVAVLLLTSKTYGEIPVLLITFLSAMLLNMGTNFIFGEISFVSNSISSVLQLALAIDYAIILCHRFSEEREHAPAREACILALSKAIPEIASSCLTTLAGLAAMMFMQFRIGFDMGMVLIKAIILSILSVFTLMPGLLMLFSKLIDRTHHRSFVPKITVWGRFVTKLKFIVPPIFVCVLVGAFYLSNRCPYSYGYSLIEPVTKSDSMLQEAAIEETFGAQNVMAILVPAGDYEREGRLLKALDAMDEVESATGLASVEIEDEDYVLTDQLTPRQFSELLDMDIEIIRLLYTAYAADLEEYGRIVNNIDNYSVSILDMFLFLYDRVDEGYVTLDDETQADLEDMHDQITDALAQLQGTEYSRMVLQVDLPEEGEETFAFLDSLHALVGRYYDAGTFYITGDSTSDYDLASSFENDNILISVLTILFVIIVLLFTFQSVGLPILLILVIQGSIWINFAVPAVQGTYIFFLSYLIVSSIQMGANIDYAIVISSRYQELKREMPLREAMIETLNLAFPTVFTSGTILTCAGTLIGLLTSDAAIYGVGDCLGRGTIISMILVMGVLPEILLLGDTIIEKTAFNIKYPALVQTSSASGKVFLDGRVRGTISGKIDAEVHGVLEGDVTAVVHVHRESPIRQEKEEDDENA
ncbi:MAG: MMPL family transporter [Oscillospiraceae bacterium]|nr:MMPL family transporter [Oscillospiraceae bacterium]